MKKCSYCGKKYPDDATVCAADGETLRDSIEERENVTGVWRGVYGYGEHRKQAGMGPVAFTLKLKQGWMGHFTGSVTEDAPEGWPGTGVIDGYFKSPTIEFTKQMPVGYITGPDGVRKTLREYFLAKGQNCEHELPGAPIVYEGTFLDLNRVQGTWTINPRQIQSPGGSSITTVRTCGFWCAEFATSDMKADPTARPAEPLFDKTLLFQEEINDVDGPALCSVGTFAVTDAEKLMNRFEQENIRFEINRDDSAIRQMNPLISFLGGYAGMACMIEIFVHPDDVQRAEAIRGENGRV